MCISATEYHLGLLKAKLAKYRSQLLEPPKKSEKGEGFDVLKSGDARVALIGFPSVGKVGCISLNEMSENFWSNSLPFPDKIINLQFLNVCNRFFFLLG
jgi:ribosome-interacting GTPase 1